MRVLATSCIVCIDAPLLMIIAITCVQREGARCVTATLAGSGGGARAARAAACGGGGGGVCSGAVVRRFSAHFFCIRNLPKSVIHSERKKWITVLAISVRDFVCERFRGVVCRARAGVDEGDDVATPRRSFARRVLLLPSRRAYLSPRLRAAVLRGNLAANLRGIDCQH